MLKRAKTGQAEREMAPAGRSRPWLCPPLVVTADEMAPQLRIFGEAVAAVAEHPDQIMHEAAGAEALHEGEVGD
jgi:hypothetical protein